MTIRKTAPKLQPGRSWIIILILELLALPVCSLILVWSGIERTDTTYFINKAQVEVRERQVLHGKLAVEKERLLSPYELRKKAEELGMHEPVAGQVRKMEKK